MVKGKQNTPKGFTMKKTSSVIRKLSKGLSFLSLMLLTNIAHAATTVNAYDTQTITANTNAASMINNVGESTDGAIQLIIGPGIIFVMAIGALLALFGFARGQKEALFTGIGLFIFAAIVRGIFALIV